MNLSEPDWIVSWNAQGLRGLADRLEATPELPTWNPGAAAVPHPQLGRRSIYQVRRTPTPLHRSAVSVVIPDVVTLYLHAQVVQEVVLVDTIEVVHDQLLAEALMSRGCPTLHIIKQ